ncbi:hypothetical protein [Thermococcus thioreducens]|uniref:Uncharacterized protein n=1 Tax=Thermococcus thioreducens TaxID=277988 RepID=A0A0Q2S1M0_9EURY|nr:hypothetical protein [Thermococcus thioreducens]ASJ13452.1 hypothetical protein A3L14_11430 [Thermococcus thioreducens]KQH81435.1 hypothetical protein AMR53_11430 [Thermococcus thioreducens]
MVKLHRGEQGKGEIGKAILASSVTAMVMIIALNVLMGKEDLITALDIAIKVIPFVALWAFLLISFFDKSFLFEEDEESREDFLDIEELV